MEDYGLKNYLLYIKIKTNVFHSTLIIENSET